MAGIPGPFSLLFFLRLNISLIEQIHSSTTFLIVIQDIFIL